MRKLKIVFTTLLIFNFISCEKEEILENAELQSDQVVVSDFHSYSSTRLFTNGEIDDIAEDHNTQLDDILFDFDMDATWLDELNVQYTDRYDEDIYEMSYGDYSEAYDNLDSESEQMSCISSNMSDFAAFEDLVEDVIEMIDNAQDMDEIESEIATFKSNITSTFSGSDIDGAYLFLAVVEKSAYYWLPTGMGGSGEGYDAINEFYSGDPQNIPELWKEVLVADGLGATSAFMYIGLGLAAGPVTLGGLAAFVGIRAAVASLSSVIVSSV